MYISYKAIEKNKLCNLYGIRKYNLNNEKLHFFFGTLK